MSYSILYRSMFVKMSDGKYIPLVEMGDNNVYDVTWRGRGRRSREWQQWVIDRKRLTYTRDEIMDSVEDMINKYKEQYANKPKPDYEHSEGIWTEHDVEKRFGYFSALAIDGNGHCNITSAQQVRNFFLKGFEQAVSFDEPNLILDLHWCTEYPHYEHRKATTEQELLTLWEELKAEKRDIWVGYGSWVEFLWDKHRRRTERKPSQPKTTGFVVQFGRDYIYQMSSRRMWRTCYLESAKKYASLASARKAADKLNQWYDSVTDTAYTVAVSKNPDTGKWEQAA